MDKKKTLAAYCGVYCGLCDWNTKIPERATALQKSLRTAEYKAPEGFRRHLAALGTIDRERCCRTGKCGNCGRCAIRKCAIAKGVFTCPDCADYPCERIKTLAKSEATLLHDGARIRKKGVASWIREQEQRRQAGFCYADVRCLPCEIPKD